MEIKTYPLSQAQKRIWLSEQANPEKAIMNIVLTVKYKEKIDISLLKKSIYKSIMDNEMMRVKLQLVENDNTTDIEQFIDDYSEKGIELLNFENRKHELERWVREQTNLPIPLFGDLYSFTLLSFDTGEYGFFLKIHHIISDGHSVSLLVKEINQNYQDLANGIESAQIEKKPYIDYVDYENRYLDSDEFSASREFWYVKLDQLPDEIELSVNKKNEDDIRAGIISFSIDTGLLNKMDEFCQVEKSSHYRIVLAALSIFIERITSSNDFLIGSANHNRSPEFYNTAGMFVSTILFRIQLEENHTFSSLNLYLKDEVGTILKKHQKYPYNYLFPELQEKERSKLYNLAKISIVGHKPENYDELDIEYLLPDHEANDLVIHLIGNELMFQYRLSVFSEEEIKNINSGLINIIREGIDNPGEKIQNLNLLDDKDKNRLLDDFNPNKSIPCIDKSFCQVFEESVERNFLNTAVVYKDKKFTYSQLNSKANSLANVLRQKGVKPEGIVGIMVDPCLEMTVAILAVLKAGGSYVPIDSTYPQKRINYILEDTETEILLTQKHLMGVLNFGGTVIDIENPDTYTGDTANLLANITPSSLAYIIYTSGSTGNPKGVMIEHGSLVNFSHGWMEFRNITPEDNSTKYAGFGFDASVLEIFPTLLAGATLHIIPDEMRLFPEELNEYYEKNHITISFLPTQFAEQFMKNTDNRSLRYLDTGGDKLRIFEKQNYSVINNYGPTEGTVCAASFVVEKQYGNIPIGKPFHSSNILILDKKNRLVPIGFPGELCIAGVSVARAYLNMPELTKEKFIANPYDPVERLYKTGDLTRWLPDGNIEFLGRIDNQVKIRGFRIELGEIEKILLDFHHIKDVVVIDRDDSDGNKFLCAYLRTDNSVDINRIKKEIATILPDYMVPTYITMIDKIPVTPNGKVDRRALPEPVLDGVKKDSPPRNSMDEELLKLWKSVLKVEGISIDDNFFQLGGHSIKAGMIIGKIYKIFNTKISLKDFFKFPTIRELSDNLYKYKTEDMLQLEQVEELEYYPLSPAQLRIFSLEESIQYNVPIPLMITGLLNQNKLFNALQELVLRHESIRTYFAVVDGKPVQKVLDLLEIERKVVDRDENELNSIIRNFIKPFNLLDAPLFRCELIRFSKKKHLLLLDFHHIVTDGTSIGIFLNELNELYLNNSLTPLKYQYKNYAVKINDILDSDFMGKKEKFWLEKFSDDIPVLDLLPDYTDRFDKKNRAKSVTFKMDTIVTDELKKLAKDTDTTLHMILFTAFNILYSKYTSNEDIVVGTPCIGRENEDMNKIIGMFVNMLPVRSFPAVGKTFRELLMETKDNLLGAYENEIFPTENLIEKHDLAQNPGRNPFFGIAFVFQNIDVQGFVNDEIQVDLLPNNLETAKFKITLECMEKNNQIEFDFQYLVSQFKGKTIANAAVHYQNIMNGILKDPDQKIGRIDLLSPEEKKNIIYGFNPTQTDYPRNTTYHELFEGIVSQFPEHTAVVFKDSKLSYTELNSRANSLAHLLIKNGVKQDICNGILLEPSLEMIVSILAVLKAGGTYVPIDPAYPESRIQFILEDSKASSLLTQKHLIDSISFNGNIIDLEDEKNYRLSTKNPMNHNGSNSLAYIIYTSGSTGKPKGVMIEHKSLLNFSFWWKKFRNLTPGDNCSKYAGFGFDASVPEIFPPLLSGCQLHIIPKENRLSTSDLNEYYEENNITVSFLPTQFAEQFIKTTKNRSLRWLDTAGDKLRFFNEQNFTLLNNYGPTETTVGVTAFFVDKLYENIPIGKPIANTEVYILDKSDNPVPIGIPGELCISGDCLARGYLNRPDLTKEKFTTNPIFPEKRMYRTGDAARWLSGGNIEFLGRIDQQVKIRGFRIELGEIEQVILKNRNVSDAVVIDRMDKDNNKYLCAYTVSEKELDIREIKKGMSKLLPEYMIPQYFIQMGKIPITANGKVNRKKLPEPEIIERNETDHVKPRNNKERIIYEAWKKVLGLNEVGIFENFFHLGGHSLTVVSLLSELQKSFQLQVNDLFKYQTIAELAENVNENTEDISEKFRQIRKMVVELGNQEENSTVIRKRKIYKEKIKKLEMIDPYDIVEYNNVLLTGVTGYLGAYLLRDLLKEKDCTVYLPVRARTKKHARERLKHKLEFYFGSHFYQRYKDKIVVFRSDLASRKLSIRSDVYQKMANTIDCIIHSAANVKHYGSYEDSYSANVTATENLLEFASTGIKKDFHHISTPSVGAGIIEGKDQVLFTEYDLDLGQVIDNVYVTTKLEAEKKVVEARQRGIRTNIYRAGNITFDYRTGIFQENMEENAFFQIMKSYIKLGFIPDKFDASDFSFVDYTSKYIVSLFDKQDLTNNTFHVTNPNIVKLSGILLSPQLELGMDKVGFDEFIDLLEKMYINDEHKIEVENILLHMGWLDKETFKNTSFITLNDKTVMILSKLGFTWPTLEPGRIKRLTDQMRE